MVGWQVALTAVVTAAVTWAIAQRQITAQHVLKERRKWREEIRATALLVHDAILSGNGGKLSRLKAGVDGSFESLGRRGSGTSGMHGRWFRVEVEGVRGASRFVAEA